MQDKLVHPVLHRVPAHLWLLQGKGRSTEQLSFPSVTA